MTPPLKLVIISANKGPLTHLLFLSKKRKKSIFIEINSLERKGIEKKCRVTEMTVTPILAVKVVAAMVVEVTAVVMAVVVTGLDMEKEG